MSSLLAIQSNVKPVGILILNNVLASFLNWIHIRVNLHDYFLMWHFVPQIKGMSKSLYRNYCGDELETIINMAASTQNKTLCKSSYRKKLLQTDHSGFFFFFDILKNSFGWKQRFFILWFLENCTQSAGILHFSLTQMFSSWIFRFFSKLLFSKSFSLYLPLQLMIIVGTKTATHPIHIIPQK